MTAVYAGAENIISSLGFDAIQNIDGILAGETGIRVDESGEFSPIPIPLSQVDYVKVNDLFKDKTSVLHTPLEKMLILSILDSISKCDFDIASPETLILVSTTKGNIDLLKTEQNTGIAQDRIYLWSLAMQIANYFNNPNTPLIISNACVSGVVGIVYAQRLISSGKYKNIVVVGGDLMSEFVVSGFQSFQSLSMQPCRPFDKNRDGLSLGEGSGSIILSADKSIFHDPAIKVLGGAISNDANHISGPSRTGDGLQIAIKQALKLSSVKADTIDSISAHGTATDYNDEMEAKAFSSVGMANVPVNSYKGYIGHTLGAAGVIESAICLQSMKRNLLFRSAGYKKHGVSKEISVIRETVQQEIITCLKTASGFGGSNAAVVFQKI